MLRSSLEQKYWNRFDGLILEVKLLFGSWITEVLSVMETQPIR
jgi:hypothetical protein